MTPFLLFVGIGIIGLGFVVGTILAVRYYNTPQARLNRRAAQKEREEEREKKKLEKEEKDRQKAEAKLADIAKQAQPKPSPEVTPIPLQPNQRALPAGIQSLEEFPIEATLAVELTRIVEGTHKRVIVGTTKAPIKESVARFGKPPDILIMTRGNRGYFIDPKKIIKVETTTGRIQKTVQVSYKLVFDVLYGEALNQDGSLSWSDDLELILADSGLDQYVTIAAFEGGFQFTGTLKKAMLLVAFLGIMLGLALNGTSHIVPQTVIHWIP